MLSIGVALFAALGYGSSDFLTGLAARRPSVIQAYRTRSPGHRRGGVLLGGGHGPGTPYELQLMVCAALHVAGCTNQHIAGLFGVTNQGISKRLLTHPAARMWNAVFSPAAFEVLRQRQVTK